MFKKIDATITKCNYINDKLSSISFTFNYKNKTYGPYDDKNLGLFPTCQVGNAYFIKINPLFPSQFTTESFDIVSVIALSMMLFMIIGMYFLYRNIFKIEKNWFFN